MNKKLPLLVFQGKETSIAKKSRPNILPEDDWSMAVFYVKILKSYMEEWHGNDRKKLKYKAGRELKLPDLPSTMI